MKALKRKEEIDYKEFITFLAVNGFKGKCNLYGKNQRKLYNKTRNAFIHITGREKISHTF